MEVQKTIQYKILRPETGAEVITNENYPLTFALLQENADRIPKTNGDTQFRDLVKEFYFAEEDWNKYRDELTKPDYPYNGLNVYLDDETTVGVQIIKMF